MTADTITAEMKRLSALSELVLSWFAVFASYCGKYFILYIHFENINSLNRSFFHVVKERIIIVTTITIVTKSFYIFNFSTETQLKILSLFVCLFV